MTGVASVITLFNSAVTALFNALFTPLDLLPSFWALTAVSVVTGLLMLLAYGRLSSQGGIKRAKGRVQAGLIATRLFQNDLAVFARIQGRIAADIFGYLKFSFKPMVILFVPLVFLLVQLNGRYGLRPFEPGEAGVVKVRIADRKVFDSPGMISLEAGEGVSVETPAVRMPARGEVAWRIRPQREGDFRLTVMLDGRATEKTLTVGKTRKLVSPLRRRANIFASLLYPDEPPITAGHLDSVSVDYPQRDILFARRQINWLVYFLLCSVLSGLLLKFPLGIQV
jgi:uncharacterized membrane protein (DUF106 family)